MMIVCLLPMLHVLACSLSSADALVKKINEFLQSKK